MPIQVAGLPILFPQESGSLAMFTAAATSHPTAVSPSHNSHADGRVPAFECLAWRFTTSGH